MIRHALAAMLGLWLTACATLGPVASSTPDDGIRTAEMALCASSVPLVSEIIVEGRPALESKAAVAVAAVEALQKGEPLTHEQLTVLTELGEALDELRGCL